MYVHLYTFLNTHSFTTKKGSSSDMTNKLETTFLFVFFFYFIFKILFDYFCHQFKYTINFNRFSFHLLLFLFSFLEHGYQILTFKEFFIYSFLCTTIKKQPFFHFIHIFHISIKLGAQNNFWSAFFFLLLRYQGI